MFRAILASHSRTTDARCPIDGQSTDAAHGTRIGPDEIAAPVDGGDMDGVYRPTCGSIGQSRLESSFAARHRPVVARRLPSTVLNLQASARQRRRSGSS